MADGSVALKAHFLGLPALTYLREGEAAATDAAVFFGLVRREFVGLWALTLVFAVVVSVQAVRARLFAQSRDLTLRQVRGGFAAPVAPEGTCAQKPTPQALLRPAGGQPSWLESGGPVHAARPRRMQRVSHPIPPPRRCCHAMSACLAEMGQVWEPDD